MNEVGEFNSNRDIRIRFRKPHNYTEIRYGKKLFGFDPGNDVEKYLNDLQNCVIKTASGIDVRHYYSAVKLMERIMYEYGCFEGVQEYCGTDVDNYRKTIKFAKAYIPGGKGFHLKQKLYYIDINGAFSASANGIPLTIHKDSEVNYKINALLKRMYDGRMRLKKAGMKIEKTIKLMMNTVYGNSIRK